MGEKALVKRDIREGARLIQALIDDHFPVSAAFWITVHDSDDWRLVIAVPMDKRTSRAAAYRQIQKKLMGLDLDLPLSRITLMGDDHPAVQNMRSLAEADTSGQTTLKITASEAFGQFSDQGYIYALGPLEYEREVLAALERMLDLGRAYEAQGALPNEISNGVDAVFLGAGKIILVEVKALKRPVDRPTIARVLAIYNSAKELFSQPVALLVVSRSGFNVEAYDYAAFQAVRIELVKWAGLEDDSALRAALSALLRD